jgi:hypothetical protein
MVYVTNSDLDTVSVIDGTTLIKYGRAIDTIYGVFHARNSDECMRNLNQIRTRLISLLHDSEISEHDYQELSAKISQYDENEIREKEKRNQDSNNNNNNDN